MIDDELWESIVMATENMSAYESAKFLIESIEKITDRNEMLEYIRNMIEIAHDNAKDCYTKSLRMQAEAHEIKRSIAYLEKKLIEFMDS